MLHAADGSQSIGTSSDNAADSCAIAGEAKRKAEAMRGKLVFIGRVSPPASPRVNRLAQDFSCLFAIFRDLRLQRIETVELLLVANEVNEYDL